MKLVDQLPISRLILIFTPDFSYSLSSSQIFIHQVREILSFVRRVILRLGEVTTNNPGVITNHTRDSDPSSSLFKGGGTSCLLPSDSFEIPRGYRL